MSFHDTPVPTGWTTLQYAPPFRYDGNLMMEGQPLTMTLQSSAATSYEVRDYWGSLVQTGTVSGTSLTLGALPRGWYRVYLRKAGQSDPVYEDLIGVASFSVLGTDSHFPDPPFNTEPPQSDNTYTSQSGPGGTSGGNPYHNWSNSYADHAPRGVAMLGPQRHDLIDATSPTAATAQALSDQDYVDAWYVDYQPDSARPARESFVLFASGGYDTGQTAGVTSTVAAMYPRVKYFEGPINEPDLSSDTPATWVTRMQAFYNAVKAGNASAKVMGPATVTINGQMINDLDAFFAVGGGSYLDAISFHFYNASFADITLGRRTMDAFIAMLTTHGLETKELWQTEHGPVTYTNGAYEPRLQAAFWMIQRLLLDQYGIPKERDYYFYDAEHGFWGYTSMWKASDGISPLIALTRVYSGELWGKTWTAALDFGDVENDHYIGSTYTNPTTGDAVIAVLCGGRTDGSVTFKISGATLVEVVSPFGIVSNTATDAHGVLTVATECDIPVYIRVPSGVTATLVEREYGENVAQWGITPSADGTAANQRRLFNGYLEAWRYLGGEESRTEYRDTLPPPNYVGGTFERARRIDTVVIHCPFPDQNSTSLLDYDLEYQDTSGVWHLLDTETEPANVVYAPVNRTYGGGSYVDSFYSSRRIFVHEFTPVEALAVRVLARNTTIGQAPDQQFRDAQSFGWDERITIREIGVYCRDTTRQRVLV